MLTTRPAKEQLNVRMSPTGKSILNALQEHYGLSQSGVLEMLLRTHARSVGLQPTGQQSRSAMAGIGRP